MSMKKRKIVSGQAEQIRRALAQLEVLREALDEIAWAEHADWRLPYTFPYELPLKRLETILNERLQNEERALVGRLVEVPT